MTTHSSLSPTLRRVVWGVRGVLALTFLAAGIAKLAGVPQMIQVFDAIGVGQWFRYVTAAVEVLGAVLLIVPITGFAGSVLLFVTMVVGVATHLLLIGGSAVPALILALLSAFVAWSLRPLPLKPAMR